MGEIYKKLETQEIVVRYIALMFLGAGINFTLGFSTMLSSLTVLVRSPTQTLTSTSTIPQTTTVLAILYFILGIIYSTCASLAFRPKHIISPLYIQITTAAFIPILMMFLFATVPSTMDLVAGALVALFLFMLSFMIFSAAGIGQTLLVRYLVGLNGTKEDTSSFGLMVNGKLKDVLKVLQQDDVREALNVRVREKIGEHSYVFRTPHGAGRQFFIVVVEDSEDKSRTQLATLSYRQTYYGITKTKELLEEQRRNTVKSVLTEAGITFTEDNADSPARLIAYDYGLEITESKLLGLRSLPPHSKAIFIGLMVMTLIMAGAWRLNLITLDMFETYIVLAAFSALFDLLPLLRTRRKESETD